MAAAERGSVEVFNLFNCNSVLTMLCVCVCARGEGGGVGSAGIKIV